MDMNEKPDREPQRRPPFYCGHPLPGECSLAVEARWVDQDKLCGFRSALDLLKRIDGLDREETGEADISLDWEQKIRREQAREKERVS